MTDTNPLNYEKSCWSVIEKMFKRNGGKHLVEHQLSSYNDFITRDLSKMLTNHDPMILSYDYDEDRKLFNYEIEITFGKYMLKPPKIYENDGVTKIMYPNEGLD